MLKNKTYFCLFWAGVGYHWSDDIIWKPCFVAWDIGALSISFFVNLLLHVAMYVGLTFVFAPRWWWSSELCAGRTTPCDGGAFIFHLSLIFHWEVIWQSFSIGKVRGLPRRSYDGENMFGCKLPATYVRDLCFWAWQGNVKVSFVTSWVSSKAPGDAI